MEAQYHVRLDPSSTVWCWLCRHAAFVMSRYKVRADGFTAHFSAFGSKYLGEVCPFGETVLAKLPLSSNRQSNQNARIPKHESTWMKGIWVGKSDDSDSHVVLTSKGAGLPWDPLAVPVEKPKAKTQSVTAIPLPRVDDPARPDVQEDTPLLEEILLLDGPDAELINVPVELPAIPVVDELPMKIKKWL
eukprot:6417298-Amphidinium_carterae.1